MIDGYRRVTRCKKNIVIMTSQKSRVDCFCRNRKNYGQYVVNLYKLQYRIGKLPVYSRVLVFSYLYFSYYNIILLVGMVGCGLRNFVLV